MNEEKPHEPESDTVPIPTFGPGDQLFRRFVLRRKLGAGGMGIVWQARDVMLDDEVALKILVPPYSGGQAASEELRRETRITRSLTHSNIVRIHDLFEDDFLTAIAMEYVDGDTLSRERLRQPNMVLECDHLIPMLAQVCAAMSYAHRSREVVHRDLKPSNIMLARDGQIKITDFGISAALANTASRLTRSRYVAGTLVYMSPQQMMGAAPTVADDVYALGSTIYNLLTSRPPFFRGDVSAQLVGIVPPPMHARRTELGVTGAPISPQFEETIAACLAKDPRDRPASMDELFAWLSSPTRRRAGAKSRAATARRKSSHWLTRIAEFFGKVGRGEAVKPRAEASAPTPAAAEVPPSPPTRSLEAGPTTVPAPPGASAPEESPLTIARFLRFNPPRPACPRLPHPPRPRWPHPRRPRTMEVI